MSALERFLEHLPARPYCTDDLTTGLKIRPKATAARAVYIQPNGPGMLWWLIYDVDREAAALAWEMGDLPPPNHAAINPVNAHAHLAYLLTNGVCLTDAAHQHPIRYAAAVQRAMALKLEADPAYTGLITKNPAHERWKVWDIHGQSYTLGELAEYVDLQHPANQVNLIPGEALGLGRNCTLFHEGRIWSYRAIRDYWAPDGLPRWSSAVLERLLALNGQFQSPLLHAEVKATAKSIAQWTWNRFNPAGLQKLIRRTHTPEIQAKRGGKATNQAQIAALGGVASGQARRRSSEQERATARIMAAQGKSTRQIGAEIGVDHSTVVRWLAD